MARMTMRLVQLSQSSTDPDDFTFYAEYQGMPMLGSERGHVNRYRLTPLMRMLGHRRPELLVGLNFVRPSMLREEVLTFHYILDKATRGEDLPDEDYYEIAIEDLALGKMPDLNGHTFIQFRHAFKRLCTHDHLFEQFCKAVRDMNGGTITITEVEGSTFNRQLDVESVRYLLVHRPSDTLKLILVPEAPFILDSP